MITIRDSIHKNVVVSDLAQDLLDTPQVQRLRRIRQLGGAYLVYPGANHTRFEHSLGAYALARKASEALGLGEADANVVQAAALLHDVGHAPFSHTAEDILLERGLRHEDISVDRIQWTVLADILAKHGVAAKEAARAVRGQGPWGELVAGDIDVDRMDYLVRDGHYTGVAVSVDVDRLVSSYRLVEGHVAIEEKALHTAEALLLDRFLMYPTVYLHHTCRAIETMLVAGVRDLLGTRGGAEEFQEWDDGQLLAAMRAHGGFAAEVVRRLETRDLYKRAWEGSRADLDASKGLAAVAADRRQRAKRESELAEACGLAPGQVILDVPSPPRMREVAARIVTRDGDVVPLAQASTLVATLEKARMDHWRWWVFAPREHIAKVRARVPQALGV